MVLKALFVVVMAALIIILLFLFCITAPFLCEQCGRSIDNKLICKRSGCRHEQD